MRETNTQSNIISRANGLTRQLNDLSPMSAILKDLSTRSVEPRIAPLEPANDEESSCGQCARFGVTRSCVRMLSSGANIVGQCAYWREPTAASYTCEEGFIPGPPHIL